MMVSTSDKSIGKDVPMQSQSEPDLDKMAQRVQSLVKFNHFYDHINFNPKQRLAIKKKVIELTNPSRAMALSKIG